MLDALVLSAVIATAEHAGCRVRRPAPPTVMRMIISERARKADIEIEDQNASGHFTSFHLNRLHVKGSFFMHGTTITICEITRVIKYGEEGEVVFLWDLYQGV